LTTKELFLTGINTRSNSIKISGIPYNEIKLKIENNFIQKRIVFIDACHSGLATMNVQDEVYTETELDIKGTYVLTSSAGNEKSFFDTNARNTFFTKELISIFDTGLPTNQPYISLDDIFSSLQKSLKHSKPQRKTNINSSDFFICKNAKYDIYNELEKKADDLFEQMDYEKAKDKYFDIYLNKSSERLKQKIEKCKEYIKISNKAKEQAELKYKQEKEQIAKEQSDLKRKHEEERIAKEQEDLKRKQEEERIAKEQAELKRKQEEERIAKEQAELKRKQESERIAKEQAVLKQKQEQERIAKEQADLKQKQEQERIAKEQADLKQKQEQERIAKEQAELKRKQENERIAKEQAELKQKQEQERIVKEQAELKRKQEEKRIENKQTTFIPNQKSKTDIDYRRIIVPVGIVLLFIIVLFIWQPWKPNIKDIVNQQRQDSIKRSDSIARIFAIKKEDSIVKKNKQDSIQIAIKKSYSNKQKETVISSNNNQQSSEIVWQDNKFGYFTDLRDNHKYKVVKIGNQIWFAENLSYKVNNGCWAYGNDESNVAKYGYYYDWKTAKKICPPGWHLPTDNEWEILASSINSMNGNTFTKTANGHWNGIGSLLKSASGWKSFNGTDIYGFSAYPYSCRNEDGTFNTIGYNGFWWSSKLFSAESNIAWYRELSYGDNSFNRVANSITNAFSVRCLKN
jgi:uncharacterized protein (TIGR02145 family)